MWVGSAVAQTTGMVLVVAFALVWIVAGRESVLLVGAAGALILLGRYERARAEADGVGARAATIREARDA